LSIKVISGWRCWKSANLGISQRTANAGGIVDLDRATVVGIGDGLDTPGDRGEPRRQLAGQCHALLREGDAAPLPHNQGYAEL
jgi:hypothetical protein